MSKHILAYFRTENDAEDVRIRLQSFQVEAIEMDALSEDPRNESTLVVPYSVFDGSTSSAFIGGSGGTGSTTADATAAAAFIGLAAVNEHDEDHDGHDDGTLPYTLSVQVKDEDYDEVVQLIRRNKGHIEATG